MVKKKTHHNFLWHKVSLLVLSDQWKTHVTTHITQTLKLFLLEKLNRLIYYI